MLLSATARLVRLAVLGCVLGAAACSMAQKPGPQSVQGMTPVGTVSMTQVTAAGAAAGSGQVTFKGATYNFKVGGGVTGGGGAATTVANGEVYNLYNISDFAGVYTENTGGIGLSTSGSSDLWLRNQAGVVVHLVGIQRGMMFSLGRDEVVVAFM